MNKALVLLSGGLDSTAALIWAISRGQQPEAVYIFYGQPASDRECPRAIAATRALGVEFHRLDLASAYYGGQRRGLFVPQPSGMDRGVDTAFVPLRNPLMLSAAAARARMLWPTDNIDLVVGFNADDVAGFPDCRADFVTSFEHAINLGLGEPEAVRVLAPWSGLSKRDVIAYVRETAPEHMGLIEASWSCYQERGPCGECTACITRKKAFDG